MSSETTPDRIVFLMYDEGAPKVLRFLTEARAAEFAKEKAEEWGVEPERDHEGSWVVFET